METALVSMAQEFTGLPMESLIGGPLNAAALANSEMAATQTKYILDTCFSKENDDSPYEPIMITMSLTKHFIDDEGTEETEKVKVVPVTTKFELPLLTIIPLNSLAVDEVNVDFHMEVKSSYSEETSEEKVKSAQSSGSLKAKIGWGPVSATIKGSVSTSSNSAEKQSSHYEKSNSASYDIKVHAQQIPLPMGVTTIINAFANSISPSEFPKEEEGS